MSARTLRTGPVVQSVSLGLRGLYVVTLLMAAVWLASNIRRVPPDSSAVVFRFGAVVRVQDAGLLLALPPPFETVTILPGPSQQISQTVAAQPRSPGLDDIYTQAMGVPMQGAAGAYLTGDGNAVLLDAMLTYRITDPAAYVVARDHVGPALDRLLRTSAIDVAGRQSLDDFLVAQPDRSAGQAVQTVAAIRQKVRDDLLALLNARLAALGNTGAPLGIMVDRIDLTAWLPPQAKLAFDALLVAEQVANQGLALAHTQALRTRQEADRESRRVLDSAQAAAAERISAATAEVSPVLALETEAARPARAGLLMDAYRSRVAAILNSAGEVVVVDGAGGNRLLLPAGK
jgi:regulator of protease activity HflC (stomatin/prohibitin superfamily)